MEIISIELILLDAAMPITTFYVLHLTGSQTAYHQYQGLSPV